jgi:hypothetical protein
MCHLATVSSKTVFAGSPKRIFMNATKEPFRFKVSNYNCETNIYLPFNERIKWPRFQDTKK